MKTHIFLPLITINLWMRFSSRNHNTFNPPSPTLREITEEMKMLPIRLSLSKGPHTYTHSHAVDNDDNICVCEYVSDFNEAKNCRPKAEWGCSEEVNLHQRVYLSSDWLDHNMPSVNNNNSSSSRIPIHTFVWTHMTWSTSTFPSKHLYWCKLWVYDKRQELISSSELIYRHVWANVCVCVWNAKTNAR